MSDTNLTDNSWYRSMGDLISLKIHGIDQLKFRDRQL